MVRPALLLLIGLLAGCVAAPVAAPDIAHLQPGQLGSSGDQDEAAINLAQWAFADAGRTYGHPVEAARAAASMDYIAGAMTTSPHWSNISAAVQQQLLEGRAEVRAALAVAPGAPSQAVVDRLTGAANALAADDEPAALRQLGPPVFTVPPEQVLARLSNMPYLRIANLSTTRAVDEVFEPEGANQP